MSGLAAENVWDYPRPPRLERVPQLVRIEFAGRTILRTNAAWRVLETTHPPSYYLPRGDFLDCELIRAPGGSVCEWKGRAVYWSIKAGGRTAERVAWSYPDPTEAFVPIGDHLAVYCAAMEACFVGDERASPQPGGFYGGWVTSNLNGPFKGDPGTQFW